MLLNVREKVKLLDVAELKLPSSAVTSWKPLLFVQRTVSPTSMVISLGSKKLLRTVTSWVAACASNGDKSKAMIIIRLEKWLDGLLLFTVFFAPPHALLNEDTFNYSKDLRPRVYLSYASGQYAAGIGVILYGC